MSKVMLIASQMEMVPYECDIDCIGVDRGAFMAMKQGVPLVCAIGDFDSIDEDEKKQLAQYTSLITLPERKNETDSEAAIHYALEKGYDDITLFGCFGGRIDHMMANMYLLMHRSYPLKLMDENNLAYVLTPGKYTISNKYRHVSLLALEDSVVSEAGVSYPLHERSIAPYDIYTVSNHMEHEMAVITIHSGRVLFMQSNCK